MSKFTGYESEIKNGNILSVQMNILNRCTSHCKSCRKYTWPNETMSVDDIRKTLSVLKNKFGLQTVVFSGGDPILHPQFSEVIDVCKELDIAFSLITTLITGDMDLLMKISENAHRIHCSVDSTKRSRYSIIRGVDGFDVVKGNIGIVNRVRIKNGMIPIRISSTISKLNFDETYHLYKFAKDYGCLINFYFLHTWDDLKMEDEEIDTFYDLIEDVCVNEAESKKVISNAKSIRLQEYDYDESYLKGCDACYIPRISATIDANGDIYPCCFLLQDNNVYGPQLEYVYGNVKGKTEEEIAKEFDKRLLKDYPLDGLCQECGQRYSCELHELKKIVEGKRDKIFI